MAALKAKMARGEAGDADAAFNELVAMQQRLTQLRRSRSLPR